MLLVFVLVNGHRIPARYAPLLDEIGQIKQQTTAAWLEFTAATQDMRPTDWQRLWQSLHRASVSGGMLEASRPQLPPDVLARLEPQARKLQQLLAKMVGSSIAYYQQRLNDPEAAARGGRFGQHYLALLGAIRAIEATLQTSLRNEMADFQRHSLMLLGFAVLLASGLILLMRAVLASNRQQMEELRRATREIRKKNVLLEQLAYFDHLTGLPNSPLFRDRVRQAILHSRREGRALVVLYLDLDGFKAVNDSMGHEAGDLLLIETAKRISRSVRREDTVSRLSGDEFAVLLGNIPDVETAEETSRIIAEKILAQLGAAIDIDGEKISVSASIGIAIHPADGDSADQLLRAADSAMYLAKSAGKNGYHHFSRSISGTRLVCEQQLRDSFINEALTLHYQPQWHLRDGSLAGLEVLVRCRDDQQGLILPEGLLPVAERNAILGKLDMTVTEQACREFSRWLKSDMPPPKIALNISPRTLTQEPFARRFLDILQRYQVPPSRVEIEISDEALAAMLPLRLRQLERLFERGVHLAVNCRGTRYQALEKLLRLPVSALKTERDFIQVASNNPLVAGMFENMVRTARHLGASIVAEGIETAEQLEQVRQRGCDVGQGYHLGRPVAADEIDNLLRDLAATSAASRAEMANVKPFAKPASH